MAIRRGGVIAKRKEVGIPHRGWHNDYFTDSTVYRRLCPRRSTRHSCLYLRRCNRRIDRARLVCRHRQPLLFARPPQRALAVCGERDEPAAGGRAWCGLVIALHTRAVAYGADQLPDERW